MTKTDLAELKILCDSYIELRIREMQIRRDLALADLDMAKMVGKDRLSAELFATTLSKFGMKDADKRAPAPIANASRALGLDAILESKASANAKLVMLVLSTYMDDSGELVDPPEIDELAELCAELCPLSEIDMDDVFEEIKNLDMLSVEWEEANK